jgi:hypothetical protein
MISIAVLLKWKRGCTVLSVHQCRRGLQIIIFGKQHLDDFNSCFIEMEERMHCSLSCKLAMKIAYMSVNAHAYNSFI